MRKTLKVLFAAAILSLITTIATAQQDNSAQTATPKWISEKGYWVVESNVKTPQTSTVYFYNNQNDLLYKEQVDGVRLNIKNRKTLMMLKQVLDKSLQTSDVAKNLKQDGQLVRNTLKSRN